MLLYPFKNLYFKTNLTRLEIADKFKSVTYLSDLNFKKPNSNAIFYGFVQKNDFALQNMSKPNFVPFIEGNFLGVENEMYVYVQFKAYKYRRMYGVLLIMLFAALAYSISLITIKSGFILLPFAMVLICFILFGAILFKKAKKFNTFLPNSIDYMRGLLEAEVIEKNKIPTIFQI